MQTEDKEEIFQGYLTEEEKQQIFNEGKKEGKKEGKREGKREGIEEVKKEVREKIVKNLIKQGDSPEKIAKATNMSIAEIIALTQE